MKSYVKPPTEFATVAREAASTGVDIIYVVDSAGNMTPDDARDYVRATRDVIDTQLGFHAHNNLGLANANAIAAIEAGCSVIDASLQGMGRCTGNTITEQFVAIARRKKWKTDYDLFALMDASDALVRPRLSQVGHDSVDLICGFAGFHSSYMDVIRDTAIKYDIDPRQLIIDVCEESRSEAPVALVDSIGSRLAETDRVSGYRHRFPLRHYFGHEQSALDEK
jgi:4-hydroxy-2-oxovalerate aldolase